MSNGKTKAEDEDLDDLDDVLDQFTKPQIPTKPKSTIPPSSPSSNPPAKASEPPFPVPDAEDVLSDEFAQQLASEMEAMMRALSSEGTAAGSAPSGSSGSDTQAQETAFREAWNKMIVQDLEGGDKRNGLDTFLGRRDDPEEAADADERGESIETGKQKAPEEEEDPFQKAIRQAMEKLQDSDDTLKTEPRNGQDPLEGLLSSLGDLKLGEDGEGDENLESMLETMMSQLMSKDILYEPLKELDTKYPDYLSKHESSLSQEDLSRYKNQKTRVSQIVAIFENPSYSDDNAAQSAQTLRLMNEMQSFGSPPSEIMGPMPPGFDFGAEGLPKLPDGCIIA